MPLAEQFILGLHCLLRYVYPVYKVFKIMVKSVTLLTLLHSERLSESSRAKGSPVVAATFFTGP